MAHPRHLHTSFELPLDGRWRPQQRRPFAERALRFWSKRPTFPIVIGGMSFASTITQTVPVEWIVVTGSLANRARWLVVALAAATASAIAAVGIYLAFHHFGWNLLVERFPDLAQTSVWLRITDWLSRYGVWALFVIMATPLPIPKLTVLAVSGIYRLPVIEVASAIWLGKSLKYCAYGFLTSRFPNVVHRLTRNGVGTAQKSDRSSTNRPG